MTKFFPHILFPGSCFSTHHRSSYRDAENTNKEDSIIYEDISSNSENVGSSENSHKNSFLYRSRYDEDYAELSKSSNGSEADAVQPHYRGEHNKERDGVR